MSRRVVLWVVFLLVHIGVAVLGWVQPNQPMGDVYFVYEPWSNRALNGAGMVGITEPWVYPQLALLPMVLAHGFAWINGYTVGWAIFVTACNALAFGLLVGRGRSRGRTTAAWFWLAFLALIGPIGMYRIDAVTVPLAVAGLLWLSGAPWVGSVLLAVGAWIKIWPAALILAGVIALRRRAVMLGGAAIVSGVVLGIVVVAGGASHALAFVTEQTGRGLQLEAPISMFYLWRAAAGIPGSFIFYDRDILTFQVAGPQVDAVIAVMTPLLAAAVAVVAVIGALKARRGAAFVTLFPPLSVALVLTLIVFNKVGSPQFESWLIAPFVLWLVLDRRRAWPPAVAALAIAALTQAVYPIAYYGLLIAEPFPVAVLTARNLCSSPCSRGASCAWSGCRLRGRARRRRRGRRGRGPRGRHRMNEMPDTGIHPWRNHMLIAFSVAPSGAGAADGSVHDAVAAAVRVVRDSGLPNRTTSMFTELEGEWDEVFDVVKRATEAVLPFGSRVSLVLKADIRPGRTGEIDGKIDRLEAGRRIDSTRGLTTGTVVA